MIKRRRKSCQEIISCQENKNVFSCQENIEIFCFQEYPSGEQRPSIFSLFSALAGRTNRPSVFSRCKNVYCLIPKRNRGLLIGEWSGLVKLRNQLHVSLKNTGFGPWNLKFSDVLTSHCLCVCVLFMPFIFYLDVGGATSLHPRAMCLSFNRIIRCFFWQPVCIFAKSGQYFAIC